VRDVNRIFTIALLSGFSAVLWAQTAPVSSIRIGSDTVPWATFLVDGLSYQGIQTFTWPQGSTHIVQVLNTLPQGNNCPANLVAAAQLSIDSQTAILFGGWRDNTGLLYPSADTVQTITADPSITSLIASFTVTYRVVLNFFQGQPGETLYCQPTAAGAPYDIPPPDQLRPGVVYIDGAAYWNSAIVYLPQGTHTLNAFPAPGFTFTGWSVNGAPATTPYLSAVDVEAALNLTPQIVAAKRVRFMTNPMGLNVLVDYTSVPTAPFLNTTLIQTCPDAFTRPPAPPPGIAPLCYGDFDFAPGSTHVIGAPTPQRDIAGNLWVFDSWAGGGGENIIYTVDNNLNAMATPTANFMPGASAYFSTGPASLPLTIDGRSNWPYPPVFTWELGSTHSITATSPMADSAGRKYTFNNWSNGGSATQQVTVDQNAVNNGLRLIATYTVLSRLIVQSAAGAVTIQVDGNPCPSPCIVDKPYGSQTRVTAPSSLPLTSGSRVDFVSWSDNSAADHVITMNFDSETVTANYQTMVLLSAVSSPTNGATFQFSPSTPDLYFPVGQPVNVTAQVNPGFKFLRWGGAGSGTYPIVQVTMAQAANVIAQLGTVPYIAPAGIQNAAGTTPYQAVAPGSLISIFGASLTAATIVGPINPLSQTLGGVVVTVTNRMLPLLFVSTNQVNAQLPPDLPEGNYTLTVSATGQPDVTGAFTVARNAPGLFVWGTDARPIALAFHQDGSEVTPNSPAQQGETVTVYGTGFGPCQQALLTGFLSQSVAPNSLIDTLTIQLDVFQPVVTFAGASTGQIGMEVFSFPITPDLPSGTNLNLTVTVNGIVSNTVLLPL
jgi:uncharacterized protein (TIGR03437 family)